MLPILLLVIRPLLTKYAPAWQTEGRVCGLCAFTDDSSKKYSCKWATSFLIISLSHVWLASSLKRSLLLCSDIQPTISDEPQGLGPHWCLTNVTQLNTFKKCHKNSNYSNWMCLLSLGHCFSCCLAQPLAAEPEVGRLVGSSLLFGKPKLYYSPSS